MSNDESIGNGSAKRGISIVLLSTLISYGINLVSLPILTRLYGPDVYGVYTLVTSLSAVIAPAASLKMESAAMLPKSSKAVVPIVAIALLSTVIIAGCYSIGVALWIAVGDVPDTARADTPIWVFVTIVLTCLYTLFSQLTLRDRAYKAVSKRNIVQAAGTSILQLLLSLVSRQAWALNLGQIGGRTLGISTLMLRTRSYFGRTNVNALKDTLRRYWRFPVVFAPSAVVNALGLQIPVLYVAATFGAAATGELGAAERVVAIPVTLIGTAVGQVLSAEFAERIRQGNNDLFGTFLKASAGLAAVAIAIVVPLAILGPTLLPLILGSEWQSAGVFVQIIAIATGIRIVSSPLSSLFTLFEKSRANVALDVLRFGLLAIAIVISSTQHLDLLQSLWLIYGALGATHIVLWLYLFFMLHQSHRTSSA